MSGDARRSSTRPGAPPLYRLLHAACTPVVSVLMRPTVEGRANVPATGPVILCANHLSAVDPVIVPIVAPRVITYLAKSEFFGGIERRFFASLGVVPVDRRGGAAGEDGLRRSERALAAGACLGVFPEGTRSPDGLLYRGRTGPARLSARTGAPLVPVGIVGSREVLPPHRRVPRRGRVTVRFGGPVSVAALAGVDAVDPDDHDLLRHATDALMRRIAQLSGQRQVDRYARAADGGEGSDGSAGGRPDDAPSSGAPDDQRHT